MAYDYIINKDRNAEWLRGQTVAIKLLDITQAAAGARYYPVHGDPILNQLDEDDLLCYFVYTLSSWWEIPLIDRINTNKEYNNFAILMDVNPAPETMYRLGNIDPNTPRVRYTAGLKEIFPSLENNVADAMYNLLRSGFGHNLFGREPGKIRFDNEFPCPPVLDDSNVLLVPPIQLALSMVAAFLAKVVELILFPTDDRMHVFKTYMTGSA